MKPGIDWHRERPRGGAANQRYELAGPHSIASSAAIRGTVFMEYVGVRLFVFYSGRFYDWPPLLDIRFY
jgi:hypothetical protein